MTQNCVSSFSTRLALLPLIVLVSSCSVVVSEINKQWPPKTTCDAQLSSVTAANADLALFGTAAAYVGVSGKDFNEQIARVIEPLVPGVSGLTVKTGQQEVVADFSFAGRFLNGKAYAAGHAILHCSVHVENVHLVLTPTFEQIHLQEVQYRKTDFPSGVIAPLNAALKVFIDNINGALPQQKIQLNTRFVQDFDPSLLATGQQNVDGVYGKPIKVDIALGRSSVLVDTDGVHLLAELVNRPPSSTFVTPASTSTTSATCDPSTFGQKYTAFRDAFVAKATADLGSGSELAWTRTSVAVTKTFLSDALNYYGTFPCASPGMGDCSVLGVTFAIPTNYVHFKETLTTDNEPDLKCGQNYPPFQPNACNRGPCNPSRGCPGSCDWWDGGCQVWKPICETLKEAERVACEVSETAKKGACEADNEAHRIAYEVEKAARIAGCQLNQKWLHEWANQDVGDVQGTLALDGTKARLALYGFSVKPDFSNISIDSSFDAHSDVLADIAFLPKNLIGHILCQARWNARITATADATKVARRLDAAITPRTDTDGGLVLEARPNNQDFDLKLSPAPVVALFTQNPQVLVACSPAVVLGLTGEIAGSVARALKISNPTSLLTDTFRYSLTNLLFPIKVPPYTIEVPGVPNNMITLYPEMQPRLIRFTTK